jgi:hypothetical protein
MNYEILSSILPRYLRISRPITIDPAHPPSEDSLFKSTAVSDEIDDSTLLCDKSNSTTNSNFQVGSQRTSEVLSSRNSFYGGIVPWLPNFFVAPGYLSMSALKSYFESHSTLTSLGAIEVQAMDISSEYPILGLDIQSESGRCNVLDLCCCPGMKLLSMIEKLPIDATIVGVDVSGRRLQVCKSIISKKLEKLYERLPVDSIASTRLTPKIYIFESDGTKFNTALNEKCSLLFDSDIFLDEYQYRLANNRKRQNKFAKARERKRLKENETIFTANESLILDSENDHKSDYAQIYDRVLVDAECNDYLPFLYALFLAKYISFSLGTHDGSYRHMQFVKSSNSNESRLINVEADEESSAERSMKPNASNEYESLRSNKLNIQLLQRNLIMNGFRQLKTGLSINYHYHYHYYH